MLLDVLVGSVLIKKTYADNSTLALHHQKAKEL